MKLGQKMAGVFAGAMMLASGAASAEGWEPPGTLKVQIGFGAGGSTDTMGRVLAKVMKEQTGWNIIAENKTGGGGIAMFTGISKMPPKGNIVGLGVNMPIMINLVTRGDKLPFNLDSFDYLGTVARAQLALIARADAPFDDIAGMIEHSKANGGIPVGFGAKPQQMLMDVVNREADAQLRFVSTKGEAETQELLLGGQIMVGFSAGTHLKYLESGDFKMIASANDARHNYAPDVATFREQGFDAYVDPYFYIAAPVGLDAEAKEALATAIDNAINSEEVKEVVANVVTTETLNLGPDDTKQMMVDGLENVKILVAE